jgi:hypothetical protein
VRAGAVLPCIMERGGRAWRLTGPRGDEPGTSAPITTEALRRGTPMSAEAGSPDPCAVDGTLAPPPWSAAIAARQRGRRPLPRTGPSRANGHRAAPPLRRTVRGHRCVARPPRTVLPRRGTRHLDGARAARRVWGSHRLAAPALKQSSQHTRVSASVIRPTKADDICAPEPFAS